MATRQVVTSVCDYHEPADEVEATRTETFAVGGQRYKADMCDDHGDAFDDAMSVFTGSAELVGRDSAGPPAKRRTTRDRVNSAAIRDRARAAGREVSERGRIPADILREFG